MSEPLEAYPFRQSMKGRFYHMARPSAGDFFLTASLTGANKTIREWAGSSYGHGVYYMGRQTKQKIKTKSGKTVYLPSETTSRAAFELPIQCKALDGLLAEDKVFRLCHVRYKKMTKEKYTKLNTLCYAFAMAKHTGEKKSHGGYSTNAAIGYAIADTASNYNNKFSLLGVMGVHQDYNPISAGARLLGKSVNGLVQTGVEWQERYPNLNCTSFIAWAFAEIGVNITTFKTTTSPMDLYRAVKDNKNFEVKEYNFKDFYKPPALGTKKFGAQAI